MRGASKRWLPFVLIWAALIGATIVGWRILGTPRATPSRGPGRLVLELVGGLSVFLLGFLALVFLRALSAVWVGERPFVRAIGDLEHSHAPRRLKALVFLGRRRHWFPAELRKALPSIVELSRADPVIEIRVEALTAIGRICADAVVELSRDREILPFPAERSHVLEEWERLDRDTLAFVEQISLGALAEASRSDIRAIREGAALAASVYAAKESPRPELSRRFEARTFNNSLGSAPKPDIVDFTVFSSPTVARGDRELVQVFVHIPRRAREAARLARQADATTTSRGFQSLEADIHRGVELTFTLSVPGLLVEQAVQSLTWRGRTDRVQFVATVPAECRTGSLIARVTIALDSIPIGHIKFKLTITEPAEPETRTGKALGHEAKRYEMAFISYASQDRDKVLARVQMLSPLGVRFFQDILELSPGDRWEKKLYHYIDQSDLFLLFWSSAASNSEWVLKEVRYALARKGDDESAPPEIYPVILEGPPVVPPPPELAHLHFNDRINYFASRPV